MNNRSLTEFDNVLDQMTNDSNEFKIERNINFSIIDNKNSKVSNFKSNDLNKKYLYPFYFNRIVYNINEEQKFIIFLNKETKDKIQKNKNYVMCYEILGNKMFTGGLKSKVTYNNTLIEKKNIIKCGV